MTNPKPPYHNDRCPACQAENIPQAAECWLCHGSLNSGEEIITAELVLPTTKPLSEIFFTTLLLGILALIVLIGIGIAQDNSGGLITYAIFIGPALIASLSRYAIGVSSGDSNTAAKSLLMFMLSLGVTIAVVIVLIAAAIIALFLYCLKMIAGGN